MATFEDGRQTPASRKLIFANLKLRKWFFGWDSDSSVWSQTSEEQVVSINENEAAMTEQASLSALQSASTTTVGAWFWDEDAAKLYIKPKSGETVYENFYLASLEVVLSGAGDTYDGAFREAKIVSKPTQNLKTSNIFDGKLARISTGALSLENTDQFSTEPDYEIDGQIELIASFEVY